MSNQEKDLLVFQSVDKLMEFKEPLFEMIEGFTDSGEVCREILEDLCKTLQTEARKRFKK
jgi:hypothetical protein